MMIIGLLYFFSFSFFFFLQFFLLIFSPAIVPDIDEIAAQAETMFAGRYILKFYLCIFIYLFVHVSIFHDQSLCILCFLFPCLLVNCISHT